MSSAWECRNHHSAEHQKCWAMGQVLALETRSVIQSVMVNVRSMTNPRPMTLPWTAYSESYWVMCPSEILWLIQGTHREIRSGALQSAAANVRRQLNGLSRFEIWSSVAEYCLEDSFLVLKLLFDFDLLFNRYDIVSAFSSDSQEKLIAIHMLKFTSTESKTIYNSEILFILFSENRGLTEPVKEERIFSKSLFLCCSEMEGSCYTYLFEGFLSFSNTDFLLECGC